MLTVSGGDRWRCTVPDADWPTDPAVREAITRDFDGRWGDRRQELVFIGQQMRAGAEQRIRNALDSCLLDDAEFAAWEATMDSGGDVPKKLEGLFDDGFEDWLDDTDGHDHEHDLDHPHGHGHGHGH